MSSATQSDIDSHAYWVAPPFRYIHINKRVSVIAVSDEQGNMSPLRFKGMNKTNEYQVVAVDHLISASKEKLSENPMMIYKCRSFIVDKDWVYELKYEINTCKWVLWRM